MKKLTFLVAIFTLFSLAFNPYDWQDWNDENDYLDDLYDFYDDGYYYEEDPYYDVPDDYSTNYQQDLKYGTVTDDWYNCYDVSDMPWPCLRSDVYDIRDLQTRLYVIGVKPAAKDLPYSAKGYTADELIKSGRPMIKRLDGTDFFDGFYQAPNKNFFPVNVNAVKASEGIGCDKNYKGACIPIVDFDLQCSDIPYTNFSVVGYDIHNFDGDGDGVACEPYYPY